MTTAALKVLASGLLAAAGAVFAAETHVDFERNVGGWTTVGFYPDRRDGLYALGEPVGLVLRTAWTNGQSGAVTATVDVREFGGGERKGVTNFTFDCAAEARTAFALPSPGRLGHFTVTASLSQDGRDLGYSQTAFVVAPPQPETRDPWFGIDKNYYVVALGDALKRLGFGGRYILGGRAIDALTGDPKALAAHYEAITAGKRKDVYGQEGLVCMADFNPDVFKYRPAVERVNNGFPALTEEELRRVREHARRCAELLSDKARVWVIQQEYDAFHCIKKDGIADNYFHWLDAYLTVARNAAEGIRAGNPSCKIAMLGMCCNDFYWMAEKFQWSKMMLPTLKGCFDCIALDAYSGNWNGFNAPLTPPDDIFTDLLKAGAQLSAEFGGTNEVVISERCAATDWVGAYDGVKARDQADYTARSLVLGKSVPEVSRYTLHVVRDYGMVRQNRADRSRRHMCDLGIWRAIEMPGERERWIPRPAVSAAGTVARKLAFAANPREIKLTDGIRVVAFDVPGGRSTVVLWAADAPLRARFAMPEGVTRCDIGGNASPVPAGETELLLDMTPVFFDMDAGGRAAFETAVAALRVTWRTPVAANATITVGEELSREPVVLAAPKAVHPSAALMPEYGFFRNDKRFLGAGEKESWPKAEARFAWTPSALRAVVTVSDKEYVEGVDTAVIEILDPMFFRTYGGEAKKLKVLSAKPVRTTGSGSTATHEFEIPWTDVPGGNPGKGGRVAFNLLCPCAPHARDRKVRYSLVLCEPTEKAAQRRFHCAFLQFESGGRGLEM